VDGKKMMADLNPNAKPGASGKATRTVRMEDGILKPAYRLPTEAEWEYAALGLAGNTEFENIEDGKIYPWNGMGVRSPKKRTRGMILANFKRGEGDNMGVGGSLNDKADITAPVRSYEPNDFGLYNMAGNVNEWTSDTYRQMTFEDVEDFNPYRGNEYTNKRLADPEKGIYAKDKYGRPIKDAAKSNKKLAWSEFIAQQQGQKAAPATTIAPPTGVPVGATTAALTGKAFKADQRGFADSTDNSLYGVTTLVNDHSKVYKGGSWNDRAMWLNPATRRFMDQGEASAEVGFRCAMSMVGAPEINPNGKTIRQRNSIYKLTTKASYGSNWLFAF
jgi:sulfatase modifying factor 1